MDIEGLAVNAVDDAISKTDYLVSDIKKNDKTPSFDGTVFVYSKPGNNHSKRDLVGIVPVQVKGTTIVNTFKNHIVFVVEISDLINFRKTGGVLYFVVNIINDGSEKIIYYLELLPYKINQILKNLKDNQKTVSLTFNEFPMSSNEVSNIFFNFNRDMEKQSLLRNGEYSIEQASKDLDLTKWNFGTTYTGIGYNKSNPDDYLLNHGIYIYASNAEGNINIPLNYIDKIEAIYREINKNVSVNGKIYYKSWKWISEKSGKSIAIGKSFKFKVLSDRFNIKYTLMGNLDERILDLTFLLAMFEEKEFSIGENRFFINPTKAEEDSFHLNEAKVQLDHLKKLKSVLEYLGVKRPLDVTLIDVQSEVHIQILIKAFADKSPVIFNEVIQSPLAYIKIGNLCVLLYFKHIDGKKYIIENFFDTKLDIVVQDQDGNVDATSQYSILREADYLNIDNINFEVIYRDFTSIKNKIHYDRVNLSCLEMLKAYDKQNEKIPLNIIERLYDWLIKNNPDEKDLYLVNLFQCYKRQRALQVSEKAILFEMIKRWEDNLGMLTGIYILLEEYNEVDKYIKQMSQDYKNEFIQFPIYSLCQKHGKKS